jgi:SAM-dependent methyltransferase
MQWKLKAAIQTVLSRVPAGSRIYRKLQDVSGSSRFDFEDHYSRKRNFLRRAAEQGLPIAGRKLLEIGTGWHPLLPLLLYLLDSKTVTIDINPWMTMESLQQTLKALRKNAARVAEDFSLDRETVEARLDALLEKCKAGQPMEQILRSAGIEYGLGVDASRTSYPDDEFDYIVSSNLMEHVPAEIIRGIVRESRRILKPGGVHLHHINPGDHFADEDTANGITTANFLKYSARKWYWIGGSGLAYHNRLRCVDFVRIFEEQGFEIVFHRDLTDKTALEALASGKLKPHADFAGYTNEELAGYICDIFARLPEAPTPLTNEPLKTTA